MRRADAPDVSESIPVITSPAAPRELQKTDSTSQDDSRSREPRSGSKPSSELRQAGAPDVFKSICVITSPVAPP
eukprot:5803409-Pyramimonas_sp.AAC.1